MNTNLSTITNQMYQVLSSPQNKTRLQRQGLRELIRQIDVQYADPRQAYELAQALAAHAQEELAMIPQGAEYDMATLIKDESQIAVYQLYNRAHSLA